MIGFAHRGAPAAGVRENTLAAFRNALERGARALESDVWLTLDKVPVLVHDRIVRSGLRRRAISALSSADLPGWLPTLDALYAALGNDFDFSLDVKDPAAALPTVEVAARHGAASRLWLCASTGHVREWRASSGEAHLVVSTSLRNGGRAMLEDRIDEAADAGADALNLRAPEWSTERVRRCHDRSMLAFAWDVQDRARLESIRAQGCDAIYSDFLTLIAAAQTSHD
ncbi:MAG TPA: glycerophosphodiester phosphodiesterase [Frankiaceae bacterium]|nr:glycerophosphodiester phosphodiesterase [Frankiaceae bacterium]